MDPVGFVGLLAGATLVVSGSLIEGANVVLVIEEAFVLNTASEFMRIGRCWRWLKFR
jgi:hypothetical protein